MGYYGENYVLKAGKFDLEQIIKQHRWIAPIKDIAKLSNESQRAITFLDDFEIAQGANGSFNPANFITHAHATKMYVNFLKVVDE